MRKNTEKAATDQWNCIWKENQNRQTTIVFYCTEKEYRKRQYSARYNCTALCRERIDRIGSITRSKSLLYWEKQNNKQTNKQTNKTKKLKNNEKLVGSLSPAKKQTNKQTKNSNNIGISNKRYTEVVVYRAEEAHRNNYAVFICGDGGGKGAGVKEAEEHRKWQR